MKRTPLGRGKPLQADPEKVRAWQRRSRKALPAQSEKRKAEKPIRLQVRQEVVARDRGCMAAGLAPGRCGWVTMERSILEVHEVTSRARRPGGHLDASNCIALCQVHHDWVTTHPAEAEALDLARSSTGVDRLPGTL